MGAVSRPAPCPMCNGEGMVEDDELPGWVSAARDCPPGYAPCPMCDGYAEVVGCPDCDQPIPTTRTRCVLCAAKCVAVIRVSNQRAREILEAGAATVAEIHALAQHVLDLRTANGVLESHLDQMYKSADASRRERDDQEGVIR